MSESFEGWAVLELMGHRRMGGYVREAALAGGSFLRIDVPEDDAGKPFTQFYPPASVYCLTPCSEEAARGVARINRPEPVHAYELRQLPPAERRASTCDAQDDECTAEDPLHCNVLDHRQRALEGALDDVIRALDRETMAEDVKGGES